ncbi:MAG: DUF3955 domain-containing protein [bacterium]
MPTKKFHTLIFIFFCLSIGCILNYSLIGSHVDKNGTLVEPFFLITLSWLFFFIGIILGIVSIINHWLKKTK